MRAVDLLQAKASLSRLVDAIEQGHASEIVITRNDRPAARLVPVTARPRLGVARGKFEVPDSIDSSNADVTLLFSVRERS